MVFQIVSVVVPFIVFFAAQYVIRRLGRDSKLYIWWLVVACVLFFVSWYLPSPLINGRDTSFTTHFLGGGMFAGLLWIYLKESLGRHPHWFIEAFSLFTLVSVLGVMNELFEIVLYLSGGMSHGINDTSWDLLANTMGALLMYIAYILFFKPNKNDSRD